MAVNLEQELRKAQRNLREAHDEIERLNAVRQSYVEELFAQQLEIQRMDELLFNIAYNNDMDGDTLRQVVRDFLEDEND